MTTVHRCAPSSCSSTSAADFEVAPSSTTAGVGVVQLTGTGALSQQWTLS
ncbi:hypothetical protein ACFY1L_52630 [Streptomyces sp. NPDC001663]